MNTRVLISCSTLRRGGNDIPVCVFESETERQTYKQTDRQLHAPVVVVSETICYDLLEVHIGELVGLQSIQDSKLK